MSDQFRDAVKREFTDGLDLFLRKNADYGNSFEEVADAYGACGRDPMLAMLPRLLDKSGRITNLTLADHEAEVDEAIIDTLRDLGTYCFMAAAKLTPDPEVSAAERVAAYNPRRSPDFCPTCGSNSRSLLNHRHIDLELHGWRPPHYTDQEAHESTAIYCEDTWHDGGDR